MQCKLYFCYILQHISLRKLYFCYTQRFVLGNNYYISFTIKVRQKFVSAIPNKPWCVDYKICEKKKSRQLSTGSSSSHILSQSAGDYVIT